MKLETRIAVLGVLTACAGVAPGTPTSDDPETDCTYSDELGSCAPTSPEAPPPSDDVSQLTPLDVVRSTSTNNCMAGGLMAGTFYDDGHLHATTAADLHVHMIVRTAGLGVDMPCDLFTTATNHTQHGVEVLGAYRQAGQGELAIFDWSCSSNDPCTADDGSRHTSPSYIYSKSFSDLACYRQEQDDGGGHRHWFLYYSNHSYKIANGRWRNTVKVWNYCFAQWSSFYSHDYDGPNPQGGNWSIVIESHQNGSPQPAIDELGYRDASINIDGVQHDLGSSDTRFTFGSPFSNTWHVFHREGNRGYGMGEHL